MRVECESCRELAVATFAIVDGAIVATCSACHATTRPAAATATATNAPAPLCPKCGAPRTSASACPSCGLAVDRMEAFTETRDAAVPEVVRTAWQRTLDGWSEPERHDELLRLVGQHSAYAWVAGRYRDAQREHPADTIGERQLDRVRRAAEATLFVSATPRPDKANKPYQSTVAILVVLVLLMAIGLGYALVRDNTTQAKPAVSQPLHP